MVMVQIRKLGESAPVASRDGDVKVIAGAQTVCERFPNAYLLHGNRS